MTVERTQGGIRPEWLVKCHGPLGGDMAMLLDEKAATEMAARLCDAAYRLLVNNQYAQDNAAVRGELDCLELLVNQWPDLVEDDQPEEATA